MSSKDQLLDAFDCLRSALLSNDVQALEKVLAYEYIGYDPSGDPQDRKMSIEAYQPGCANLDTYEVEDVAVRIIGEVGVITGTGYIHGTFAGCEFEHTLRFLDIYVDRDGGWQLYLSQVTPLGPAEC
jgi:hypothetical protein